MAKTTRFTLDESTVDVQNPTFCYILGFIAADGYIDLNNNRICFNLSEQDASILPKIIQYFDYSGKICFSTTPKATYTRLNIVSKKLVEEVVKYITPINKTYDLCFPELPFMKDFVRGYLDGDGNIRKKGFRCTTASETFIEGLKNWLNSNYGTLINVTYQKAGDKKYPKIEVSSKKGIEILKDLYASGIAIDRKRSTVYDIVRSYGKNEP